MFNLVILRCNCEAIASKDGIITHLINKGIYNHNDHEGTTEHGMRG